MIRVATLDDVEQLADMHVAVWRSTYQGMMPDDYLAAMNPVERHPIWIDVISKKVWPLYVADKDQRIVGFAYLCASAENKAIAELKAINVLADYAYQGIGSDLLQTCLKQARDKQFSSVMLWVVADNIVARKFYTKHGFSLTSKQRFVKALNVTEYNYLYTFPADMV